MNAEDFPMYEGPLTSAPLAKKGGHWEDECEMREVRWDPSDCRKSYGIHRCISWGVDRPAGVTEPHSPPPPRRPASRVPLFNCCHCRLPASG